MKVLLDTPPSHPLPPPSNEARREIGTDLHRGLQKGYPLCLPPPPQLDEREPVSACTVAP